LFDALASLNQCIALVRPRSRPGTWYGIFAPARTPGAIVKRLNAEIAKVLTDAEIQEKFGAQGLEIVIMTPVELKRHTEQETIRWTRLVKTAGIKAQ
jgi:tripartite-type tricarboxylate transporter receptor subunit TctC